MSYQITWEKNKTVWNFHDVLTGKQAIESHLDVYGDKRFDDLAYKIIDLSSVTEFQFSESELKKIAYLDSAAARSNPRIKIAVITSTLEAEEIMQRYQKYSNNTWQMKFFKSRPAADAWVHLKKR